MRKRKTKHSDLTVNLIDDSTMSTPTPDYGMKYKGSDMFWVPEDYKNISNVNETLDELLLLVD